MTRRTTLTCICALALSIAGYAGQVASATAPTTGPATKQVIVMPVTATGEPAAGYFVEGQTNKEKVECYGPSVTSMSSDVDACGSSADDGYACLLGAAPHHVLCLIDALKHELITLTYKGTFSTTPATSTQYLAPMDLVLADGTRCARREGGADGTVLRGHRSWSPLYYCNHGQAVWTPQLAAHAGVDEASAAWTVHTAPANGKGTVVVRRIVTAYFVGSATD